MLHWESRDNISEDLVPFYYQGSHSRAVVLRSRRHLGRRQQRFRYDVDNPITGCLQVSSVVAQDSYVPRLRFSRATTRATLRCKCRPDLEKDAVSSFVGANNLHVKGVVETQTTESINHGALSCRAQFVEIVVYQLQNLGYNGFPLSNRNAHCSAMPSRHWLMALYN